MRRVEGRREVVREGREGEDEGDEAAAVVVVVEAREDVEGRDAEGRRRLLRVDAAEAPQGLEAGLGGLVAAEDAADVVRGGAARGDPEVQGLERVPAELGLAVAFVVARPGEGVLPRAEDRDLARVRGAVDFEDP